jgi:transposase
MAHKMISNLEAHYAQLLGLDDTWIVTEVDLSKSQQQVIINVLFVADSHACPDCETVSPVYDVRGDTRQWRHMDTMQFETIISANIPRIRCKEHGIKSIRIPWSEKNSRFTLLFESFALRVLQIARSVEEARRLLGLNWHQLEAIKRRGVARGLSRRRATKIRYLGIDEKSKGKGHDYVTLVNDIEGSRVLEVVPKNTQEACEVAIDKALSKRQRGWVEAVAIDMWPAFIGGVSKALPKSAIVHDRFHISKHLNDAVDKVRREEHAILKAVGDNRLTRTRYHWLKNEENLSDEAREEFKGLKDSGLKVSRAWLLKELFRQFWDYRSAGWAMRFYKSWYSWAIRCRLEPIKKEARMIKNHLDNIMTWFKHPISNAVSEGLNSKIQTVKSNARGYRSFESYRISILFYCGKLDMDPIASQ